MPRRCFARPSPSLVATRRRLLARRLAGPSPPHRHARPPPRLPISSARRHVPLPPPLDQRSTSALRLSRVAHRPLPLPFLYQRELVGGR
ncbi:hypothetical protein BRADI_4g31214v3 [Brachypodium distachyon]|uniref:Uncharacterized protein n=1 Tax=Brachypodium distachyon TaxID=15368 RepID=A0A2K2CRL2_BRADI|nr:hypothetical protein BRADI_4g31214v3 [Brachypodium distachyon]